jgi:RNA polymerase-binding transcription factor DksA
VTIDLEVRREELLTLRERILAAAEGIVADDDEGGEINSAVGDQHLADHASDILDRELDDTLEENAGHMIEEIDDALERIAAGTYGLCAVCGNEIPEERLAAVPYATLCVDDKRKRERG